MLERKRSHRNKSGGITKFDWCRQGVVDLLLASNTSVIKSETLGIALVDQLRGASHKETQHKMAPFFSSDHARLAVRIVTFLVTSLTVVWQILQIFIGIGWANEFFFPDILL